MSLPRRSIVLRMVLLTSSILTIIFAATGYLLSSSISARATQTVEQEVVSSFQAYESLWQEHTKNLQQLSRVISRMADVRAAFLTHDKATIQDTAEELWSRTSPGNALFTIADGSGKVIASLGERSPFAAGQNLGFLQKLVPGFPRQQTGFLQDEGRLFQIIVTPVYVDGSSGQELLDVLMTGFELDRTFLRSLKLASGGSDLIFKMRGSSLASTIGDSSTMHSLGSLCKANSSKGRAVRMEVGGIPFLTLSRSLPSLLPGDSGELCIVRSLANSEQALQQLRNRILVLWLAGLLAAIGCTYEVVRRMMKPVAILDRAASEIARGNYQVRIQATGHDELGRLADSFNSMCASLENARAELIRHERLASVARLATFVVHDLRNPLASIYAGAEMLVDNDLPDKQVKRLARNMYDASRGVLEILTELVSSARNKTPEPEMCFLQDLVNTAWNNLTARGLGKGVEFESNIPSDLELPLDRAPMERVFHNLLENGIEAISGPGKIRMWAEVSDHSVLLHLTDTGRGIHPELRSILFQPFASKGNVEGLGLGLALSRQTVLAHGGDLWADFDWPAGSHFVMRLPIHTARLKAS